MRVLTIISYNLWAKNTLKKDLLEWIQKNIIDLRPDVILFQEVTNAIVVDLTTKLRISGYQFKISNQSRNEYEMICSKWPIRDFKFKRFSNSPTYRGVLWCIIVIDGRNILVANSQLEQDINNFEKRTGQLQCLFDSFSKSKYYVIMGCDTGLRPKEEVENKLFQDAWIKTGKNKFARYTFDSERNSNVTEPIQSRPDRIYIKGDIDEISFQLIGTNFLSDKQKYNPSNRFGISFSFRIK